MGNDLVSPFRKANNILMKYISAAMPDKAPLAVPDCNERKS